MTFWAIYPHGEHVLLRLHRAKTGLWHVLVIIHRTPPTDQPIPHHAFSFTFDSWLWLVCLVIQMKRRMPSDTLNSSIAYLWYASSFPPVGPLGGDRILCRRRSSCATEARRYSFIIFSDLFASFCDWLEFTPQIPCL